jgi:hypothetical protein
VRRRDRDKADGRYENMSPELRRLKEALSDAHAAVDAQVQSEYPPGTRVTVENWYPNRDVSGPVVGYCESSRYTGACLLVQNEKTSKTRRFCVAGEFIYKDPV